LIWRFDPIVLGSQPQPLGAFYAKDALSLQIQYGHLLTVFGALSTLYRVSY